MTTNLFLNRTRWLHSAFCTLILLFSLGVGNVCGAIASGTYVLCTSTSDLEANAHYIIASGTSGSVYCISNVSQTNYREIVSASVSNSKITVASNSTIMTFTLGGSTDAWTFYTDNYAGTDGYLASAASGNNNYCRVLATSTTGTISISSNVATIALNPHSTRKYLKYNSGSSRFACYSSGQSDVYLYKLSASCDDITPTLSYTSTNLTIGGGNSSSPTLNKDGSSGAVTWSSDDEDVATVNSSGVVTPVGTGTCNITASIAAAGGKCAGEVSVEFTVTRTITYYVGSTSYTVGGIDGETLVSTLPASPSSCDAVNYPYFYGWVTSPIVGSTSDAPAKVTSGDVSAVTAASTYYAVFTSALSGYNLVEAAPSNWAGDYLIAYSSTVFADGRTGGTSGIGSQYNTVNPSTNLSGKVVDATWGDTYKVIIERIGATSGYMLKTQDGLYNYKTDNNNGISTTSSASTADDYPLTITFNSSSDIDMANASGAVFHYNTDGYFRFYKNGGQSNVYLYKKAAGSGTYVTTCCTQLGTINGSFFCTAI